MEETLQSIQKVVTEIKAELHNELMGGGKKGNPDSEGDLTGLLETTTVRQIVERVAYDLGQVKKELDERFRREDDQAPSFFQLIRGIGLVPVADAKLYMVKEIRSRTSKEEQENLRKKASQLRAGHVITDGASLQEASGAYAEYQVYTKIVISNYTDQVLDHCQSFVGEEDHVEEILPESVVPKTRELIVFGSASRQCIYGICSYVIGNTDTRLVICFGADAEESISFGLALLPLGVQINEGLFSDMWSHDKGRITNTAKQHMNPLNLNQISHNVQSGRHFAFGFMAKGPKSILSVELLEDGVTNASVNIVGQQLDISPSLDSLLMHTKPGTHSAEEAKGLILTNRGCIVELVNLLNVPLEDSETLWLTSETSQDEDFAPFSLFAFERTVFTAESSGDIKGMFSYRIASTDLRLAVAFNAVRLGNSVAMAFVDQHTDINKELFDELNDAEDDMDRKCVYTRDGPQTIECRNIRAWASVTDERKTMIKIVIYTV